MTHFIVEFDSNREPKDQMERIFAQLGPLHLENLVVGIDKKGE